MTTCLALFRGINVGGHHTVSMGDLKGLHESLGLTHVVTYINSGNVVFSREIVDPALLTRQLEEGFVARFGFHSAVILRTAPELDAIIANNPFQNQPAKESNLVIVTLLAAHPTPEAAEDLHKALAGPEEMHLVGRELYVYYPNGSGRSKLTNSLIEKRLKIMGTGRNWNTILQLQKMLAQP
jgi:uncharacterized protein (DUF1697 family)